MTDAPTSNPEIWHTICDDINDLAVLELSIRRRISGADFEDLKQTTAFQILRATNGNPGLLSRFENRDTRRAYISTTLRFAANKLYRDVWNKRSRSLAEMGNAVDADSPLDTLFGSEASSLVEKLCAKVPLGSDARFVLEHFLLGLSFDAYAAAHGMHVRTAYRRFANGVKEIRNRFFDGDSEGD